jgi:hypothetical protein
MAKKKKLDMEDAVSVAEESQYAHALAVMRKRNKYKPIPKFKGGCKDC